MRFYYFNAHSLRSKLLDFHEVIYSGNYNVICVTETWLDSDFTNGLLDPLSKFVFYRHDRCDVRGGGVCILIHKDFNSLPVNVDYSMNSSDAAEIIACTVLCRKLKITIAVVYLAPNLSSKNFLLSLNQLRNICNRSSNCVILGDFNQPKIDWISPSFLTDLKSNILFYFYTDLGLSQLVNDPTRNENILDLIFTNDPLLISNVQVTSPFSTSDHNAIIFSIYVKLEVTNCESVNKPVIFNWQKANWDLLRNYCANIYWCKLFSASITSDDCWNVFVETLRKGCTLFVPMYTPHKNTKRKLLKAIKHSHQQKAAVVEIEHCPSNPI